MAMATIKEEFDARICMQLAIEEMNKSINEPRRDGKVPPKVGAVLLFPDGKIVGAHRGELREGDHAEYTLIERKLANLKLDDCILFTTLEPCHVRNPPKIACCKRTTNARIKMVYIGIEDPDPTVSGKGIVHLEKRGVKVLMFDRDLQREIEKENKDFLRQAVERKQAAEQDEVISLIEQPVSSFSFNELSAEALQTFIDEAKLPYQIDQPEFRKYLTDAGVLGLDNETKQLKPTGFGVLLFGMDPRLIFKQASLKCSVDYGDGKVEAKDFDQPLVLIPSLVEGWIRKVLPSRKDTSTFKREDIPVFPIKVLREAIINAIVHRDYSIEGAKSSLQINHDKIVVKSPGAPVPAITLEQLNMFKAPSISRNPIITFVFNKMGYVEELGFGMDALKSLQPEYHLPLPEYSYEEPFLTLTFPRSMEAVKRVSSHPGIEGLNEEELKGYEFAKLKGELSKKEYAEEFNYDDRKALRHLTKMKRLKLVGDNGEKPNSPKFKYTIA
jgi:ATP-dependent DNA helicase RecG